MSLKIWLLFMYGFMTYLSSSAKFCVRRYVNGKWISKGDCGGPERMSGMQKELQRKIKDEKNKKCIASNGWIVFQCRINGDVDFYRGWDDYKKGFGNSEGDFWLGLEELHEQTKEGDMELEINMITKDEGIHWVAKYSFFSIGPGSDMYRLRTGRYSGNATWGDRLGRASNLPFSTYDADHDGHSSVYAPTLNCSSGYESGWWYYNCGYSNLNGNFNKTGWKGICWGGSYNSDGTFVPHLLQFSEMKIRKKS